MGQDGIGCHWRDASLLIRPENAGTLRCSLVQRHLAYHVDRHRSHPDFRHDR